MKVPSLTKSQFEFIAHTIKMMIVEGGGAQSENITAREISANTFANSLCATNAHFDRAKFLKACGV